MKKVNGYEITFNDYFDRWVVYHENIGVCGDFSTEQDAIDYCLAG